MNMTADQQIAVMQASILAANRRRAQRNRVRAIECRALAARRDRMGETQGAHQAAAWARDWQRRADESQARLGRWLARLSR